MLWLSCLYSYCKHRANSENNQQGHDLYKDRAFLAPASRSTEHAK